MEWINSSKEGLDSFMEDDGQEIQPQQAPDPIIINELPKLELSEFRQPRYKFVNSKTLVTFVFLT